MKKILLQLTLVIFTIATVFGVYYTFANSWTYVVPTVVFFYVGYKVFSYYESVYPHVTKVLFFFNNEGEITRHIELNPKTTPGQVQELFEEELIHDSSVCSFEVVNNKIS